MLLNFTLAILRGQQHKQHNVPLNLVQQDNSKGSPMQPRLSLRERVLLLKAQAMKQRVFSTGRSIGWHAIISRMAWCIW